MLLLSLLLCCPVCRDEGEGEGEARAHNMKVITMTMLLCRGNVIIIVVAMLPGVVVLLDKQG